MTQQFDPNNAQNLVEVGHRFRCSHHKRPSYAATRYFRRLRSSKQDRLFYVYSITLLIIFPKICGQSC
jgi:hypothetical protein